MEDISNSASCSSFFTSTTQRLCDGHIFRIFKNKLQLVAKYVSQKNAGQVFDSSYTVQGLLCIKIHMSSIRLNVALATGNFCMS